MLAGCGGGNTSQKDQMPPKPKNTTTTKLDDVSLDSDGEGTRTFDVVEEGKLTIPIPSGSALKARILDANGVEIPGRPGSWVVVITDEILEVGNFVTIEFYDGTPNQDYDIEVIFEPIARPQIPDNQNVSDNTPIQDAGQLLASGNILTGQHIAALSLGNTPEDGGPNPPRLIDANFSITRNAEGEYTVLFADDSHTFTTDQLIPRGGHYNGGTGTRGPDCPGDPIESRRCGGEISFRVKSADLFNALNSGHSHGDHYIAFGVEREGFTNLDDADVAAYAIAGQPTPSFNVMNNTTAIYDNGSAFLDIWSPDFSRESYSSNNVTFVADFDRMQISGRIHNFTDEDGEDETPFLIMPWTNFDMSGFDGNFVVDGLDPDETAELAFDGSFFGPNVDNVAGTIEGTYREGSDPERSVVTGLFFADR